MASKIEILLRFLSKLTDTNKADGSNLKLKAC